MSRKMMDIGLTGHTRLTIKNGDFVIVESTGEHQYQLLKNNTGDIKDNPTAGVGIDTYEDDDNPGELVNAITKQYMADGMEVDGPLQPNTQSVADNTVNIFTNAYYP